MRVLHLTLSYSHGGRREAIAALARGLSELGVQNHLCCLDELGSKQRERSAFVDTIALDRQALFDLTALLRLRRYCRDKGIDILHAHDAASEAMSALAMPGPGVPLLMSFHRTRNFESARFRDRLRNALVGLRVSKVVTASQERRDHYIGSNYVRADKVMCIPLGIDLDRFRDDRYRRADVRSRLGVGADQRLVGTAGHFGPEKGVDLAIGAFQHHARACPGSDVRLVILGRGEPEDERRVRSCIDPSLAGRIIFAGFQTEPELWFPAFDVLLHGARREAFGLVLAEAQACAVPVVAARVGGIPDVVADGITGRLADSPTVEALSAALSDVLYDEDRRQAMATAAVARARQAFSRARYARDYLDVYESLLKR